MEAILIIDRLVNIVCSAKSKNPNFKTQSKSAAEVNFPKINVPFL